MAKKHSRKAKKFLSSLHPMTRMLMVLFLLLGLVGGAVTCLLLSREDRFILKGETAFSIDVGASYAYTEEGFEAVCFGRDLSGKVQVETDLQKDANGNYVIPTDKEGVFTITYTVECFKFGEKAPNGVIKRIRTFTVNDVEEDGHNGT